MYINPIPGGMFFIHKQAGGGAGPPSNFSKQNKKYPIGLKFSNLM